MTPAAPTAPIKPPRPALGRDYWRLWWANAVSSTGDGAFAAALPLLAVTITRDPRLVSVVTAATYLPWMVLSLPAGALVDRHDQATLMWRAQVVQAAVAVVVAILVIARQADIAVLALGGLLLGSAEVIFSNAAQSVLPALVPPELLAKANGNQQVSLTVGESFLGPPVGSLLFAAAAALPFGLDAASFAGSAALLARLPRQANNDAERPRVRVRTQIADGLRWLTGHPDAARQHARLRPGPGGHRGSVLGGLMAVEGFFITMWNVVTVSLRQQLVPAALRGRVNSAYRMVGWGLMPVGALAGGFVAHAAGLRASYLAGGILCSLVLLAALPFLLSASRAHDDREAAA